MKSLLIISILSLSLSQYALGSSFDPGPFPEMLPVDRVSFWMGADKGTGESDEHPKHLVSLSPYSIGRFEVTNAQYALILNWAMEQKEITVLKGNLIGEMDRNYGTRNTNVYHQGRMIKEIGPDTSIRFQSGQFIPGTRDGVSLGNHPVESVTWFGAAAYANWLSRLHGFEPCYDKRFNLIQPVPNGYRLPTEAEWERAASWEQDTPSQKWKFGIQANEMDATRGNFHFNNPLKSVGMNSHPLTSPVGYFDGLSPNTKDSSSPVGCYDMSGNVIEWCEDSFSNYTSVDKNDPIVTKKSEFKIVRGGGWNSSAAFCRVTNRGWTPPHMSFRSYGFRVARSR